MNKKMMDALNEQVNKELFSGYLYLQMVAYFEENALGGFASWFKAQAQEELYHAMKIFDFIHEVGGEVDLQAIEMPKQEFDSPLAIFKEGLEHEKYITKSIHDLVELAIEEKEYAAYEFLQWFVAEQVEEEDNFSTLVDQLTMAGESGAALLMLNANLANRQPLPIH